VFCNNCGKPIGDVLECQFCGWSAAATRVPAAVAVNEEASASAAVPELQPELVSPSPLPRAPYDKLVLSFLINAVLSSVAAFLIAYSLPLGETRHLGIAIACSAIAVLGAYWCRRLWFVVVQTEPQHDGAASARQSKVLTMAGIMLLLFWAAAAGVGWAIGRSGVETEQRRADSHRMGELASVISRHRSAAGVSIQDNIEMYESIEEPVEEYQECLARLEGEWALYQQKHPNSEAAAKSLRNISRESERAKLLMEQIDVAKQMLPLAPAYQRTVWQQKMTPLLQAENELDTAKAKP
jgi:hypothetical protein